MSAPFKKKWGHFSCPWPNCNKPFKLAASVTRHMKHYHEGKPRQRKFATCPKCQKVMLEQNLKAHLNIHDKIKDGELECELCLKVFFNKLLLRAHQRNFHSSSKRNSEGPYPCQKCGKLFNKKAHVNTHEKFHCPKNPKKKRLPCHICSKLIIPYYYNIHIRACSGRKEFHCYFCQKGFSQVRELQQHLRKAHTKEKPFACEQCGFRTGRCQYDVKRHVDIQHNKEGGLVKKLTLCYFCGKGYPRLCHVADHMNKVHIMEKPYKCEKCLQQFPTKCRLKSRHITKGGQDGDDTTQHCGEQRRNMVECPKCLKILTKRGLPGHIKNMHEDQDGDGIHSLEGFKCPVCHKLFRTRKDVERHMITHDPDRETFTCDECGVNVYSKKYLKKHKEIHKIRVKISCPVCSVQVLPDRYNLHIRDVHGPPRHGCYFCGKAFKTDVGLNSHLLIVHKLHGK